jgi:hypothetical protein
MVVPRDPRLLRGVGPTSADVGRREASPANYGEMRRVVAASGVSHDDVEWTAECELAAVDSGGSAKLAEAAAHYDLTRFVLASAVGYSAIRQPVPEPGEARLCWQRPTR